LDLVKATQEYEKYDDWAKWLTDKVTAVFNDKYYDKIIASLDGKSFSEKYSLWQTYTRIWKLETDYDAFLLSPFTEVWLSGDGKKVSIYDYSGTIRWEVESYTYSLARVDLDANKLYIRGVVDDSGSTVKYLSLPTFESPEETIRMANLINYLCAYYPPKSCGESPFSIGTFSWDILVKQWDSDKIAIDYTKIEAYYPTLKNKGLTKNRQDLCKYKKQKKALKKALIINQCLYFKTHITFILF
jgi:hypothetical protein